jgi:hypothetical protein
MCLAAWALAEPPAAPVVDKAAVPDAALIVELEKTLNGATLVGHFTITGKDPVGPSEERYKFGEVKYLGNDLWLLQARIHYGENDVALPLTLPIKWAGDTPMITVDKVAFPGLGTYSARVMFFDDHYAGFWTGDGDHRGHLYGRIERAKPASDEASE